MAILKAMDNGLFIEWFLKGFMENGVSGQGNMQEGETGVRQ